MVGTSRSRRLNAFERGQIAAFHEGVIAANGLLPTAPPLSSVGRRRGGRPTRVSQLTDIAAPSGSRGPQGLLRQMDRTYTFSRDGTRIHAERDIARRRVPPEPKPVEDPPSQPSSVSQVDDWSPWTPLEHVQGDGDEPEDQWEDEPPDTGSHHTAQPMDKLDAAGDERDADDSDSDDEPPPTRENRTESGTTPTQAKRYQSSDDPMAVWLPLQDEFLAEILTHEHIQLDGACMTCKRRWAPGTDLSSATSTDAESLTDALYRCETCGDILECRDCCMRRHERTPLHSLRVWKSAGFFERTTLRNLGLIYQLGHSGGKCAVPRKDHVVTVIHVNGVHQVRVMHCGCDRHADERGAWRESMENGWYPASTTTPQSFATYEVLNFYRRLNVTAQVNVRDFITALERMTDPLGMDWVPDRYIAFAMMSRQWSFLKRMRRTGIGHLPGGIKSATFGSAAVRCWACPRPKVNLPPGWRDVEENLRFKYQLYIGLDANFRMESKLRKKSKHKSYPILADGLGCIVPNENYSEHLKRYVKEEDVSTCIAFAALMQKETRQSSGLRSTGVGGCTCTRHEIIRPLGLGDLLKGERYANMDYVFWASILGEEVAEIMVSYDIGCQWQVKLHQRRSGMPALLKEDASSAARKIHVATPVWHGAVHEEDCMMSNSLRYKVGAAMTDGEGVERVWAALNPTATATKEMHADGRHENLEDAADNHNFQKNLALVNLLPRRLYVAKDERAKQLSNFHQTSMTLSKEVRDQWLNDIVTWHVEDDVPTARKQAKNPYTSEFCKKDSITEKDARLQLAEQELEELKALNGGQLPKGRKSSQTMFLTIAMRLDAIQQRIIAFVKARVKVDEDRDDKLDTLRKQFWKLLLRFRALQETYMSGVRVLIDADEEAAAARGKPTPAEGVRLWLPSEIPVDSRATIGKEALYDAEAVLRHAQCSSALEILRLRLHTKRHFIMFRNTYMRGQRKTGRARTLIDSVSDGVDAMARKYRRAREALFRLGGEEKCGEFKELTKEDVRLRYVQDHDAKAARRLAKIAGRPTEGMTQGTNICSDSEEDGEEVEGQEERGASRQKLSWIWTAQGAPSDDNAYLHDSVRVEWCKAHARKERWREEVVLGEEEMPRTLMSLKYEAQEWRKRADMSFGGIKAVKGRRAYALRQAAVYDSLHASFVRRWSARDSHKRKRALRDVGREAVPN